MERLILFVPFAVGLLLIAAGTFIIIFRIKGMHHVEGVVMDIARTPKRYMRINMNMEAPVVRYEIDGVEYCAVSRRSETEGLSTFYRGQRINIRVSRRDLRRFVPEESGKSAEKLLISLGVFLIIAYAVSLARYSGLF